MRRLKIPSLIVLLVLASNSHAFSQELNYKDLIIALKEQSMFIGDSRPEECFNSWNVSYYADTMRCYKPKEQLNLILSIENEIITSIEYLTGTKGPKCDSWENFYKKLDKSLFGEAKHYFSCNDIGSRLRIIKKGSREHLKIQEEVEVVKRHERKLRNIANKRSGQGKQNKLMNGSDSNYLRSLVSHLQKDTYRLF